MTIEDEILQYLHYHPLSNRVEITLGITNPPSGRIVKRLLADAVTCRMNIWLFLSGKMGW
jgi:hypothetical protein